MSGTLGRHELRSPLYSLKPHDFASDAIAKNHDTAPWPTTFTTITHLKDPNAMVHIAQPLRRTPSPSPRATSSSAVGPCQRSMCRKITSEFLELGARRCIDPLLPHCYSMHTQSPTGLSINVFEPRRTCRGRPCEPIERGTSAQLANDYAQASTAPSTRVMSSLARLSACTSCTQ